ncbi:MAG: GTPase HflX [Clostridia bacterium]|nr:GTPase HflX [Clostridia bacterium]
MSEEKREYSRAALVGIITGGETEESVNTSLDELTRLLETAGGEATIRLTQKLQSPNPATLIGEGKLGELYWLCRDNGVEIAVFDSELSPSQIRNIENVLGDVRVIDRTMLILDIFALHAKTGEGRLQVELAQLRYTAPRLTGHGVEMSRLGGGIGTRGPGESKLESDRRHVRRRITALEAELEAMERTRMTMRASRDRSGVPKVAIVGYTNAGKSTLLNRLTDAGILAEDKLFATLDPTTRKFTLPGGTPILLTDTVGFIRKLPHQLVKAFRSTLEEAVYADILILLADASDPESAEQIAVTEQTLTELGAGGKPMLYVFNKCDRGNANVGRFGVQMPENVVYISAVTGQGIETLVGKLEALVLGGHSRETLIIPNREAGVLNQLYKNAVVEDVEYGNDSITVTAVLDAKVRGQMKKYVQGYAEPQEDDYE